MVNVLGLSFSFINLLTWVAFGLVTGLIASAFSTERLKGGVYGAIILGIIGALAGGAIATFVMGVGMRGFDLTSFAIAIAGAILFLIAHRLILHEDRHIKTRSSY